MIAHIWTGLALGNLLTQPSVDAPLWLILALALLAHIVLDLVPHWDYTHSTGAPLWAAIDVTISVITIILAHSYLSLPTSVLLAGAISALPDLDVIAAIQPSRRKGRRWFPSHLQGFPHGQCAPRYGIALQVGVIVISAALVVL